MPCLRQLCCHRPRRDLFTKKRQEDALHRRFAPSIVQFGRSIVSVQRLALLLDSVLGQQLRGGDRRLSSRRRVATIQPFEPSPTNALCLSFDAHYESNDVMQKTVPFGPPPRISNPIILSRQPCPKTRVPKINPIKDCLALGNRIELECIVLRASQPK